MSNNTSFYFRSGETECRLEGEREFVEQHIPAAINLVLAETGNRTIEIEHKPHTLSDGTNEQLQLVSADISTTGQEIESQSIDLLSFFQTKRTQEARWHEVVIIAYYYRCFEGKVELEVGDFRNAYRKLRELGVKKPSNISQYLKNAIKHRMLYADKVNGNKNLYAITTIGKEFVETSLSN